MTDCTPTIFLSLKVAKTKEPEYEFVPPDFDEREFILKDIFGTKITIVVAVMAVIMGVICGLVYKSLAENTGLYVGLVLMFGFMFLLKRVLKLITLDPDMLSAGSESTGSSTKSMVGNYFVYLFLCLAVWILFINSLRKL